jgi:hypothetical protein
MAKNVKSDKAWTVRDAKAHFSEVFERALKSPQRVVRNPRDGRKAREVVVLSADAFESLTRPDLPFGDFLASFAFDKFEPSRDESFDREIDFSP